MITAEEFYQTGNTELDFKGKIKDYFSIESYDEGGYLGIDENELFRMMKEFARLHVTEALNTAAMKAKINGQTFKGRRASEETQIDKESIINAYPLTNIL